MPFKTAKIQFYSQKDYHRFYEYYNGCQYFNRPLEVKPVTEAKQSDAVKAEQYIDFKWSVWQSCCKALVQYASPQEAQQAMLAFKGNPQLDNIEITASCEGSSLTLENLNSQTD
jgi:hypothetical protein